MDGRGWADFGSVSTDGQVNNNFTFAWLYWSLLFEFSERFVDKNSLILSVFHLPAFKIFIESKCCYKNVMQLHPPQIINKFTYG